MHTKKLMTLLLAVVMVLSLAACGAKGGEHMDGMDNEPKNAEEAAAMHKELTAQEAAVLAENTALWEKVFMAADKGKIMMEDGKNYGDFLLETIYAAAYEAKDFRAMQMLDWFIKEQGEEEKNAADLITKMELFGGDSKGLYMLNSELKARVYTAPSLVL